MQFEAGARCLLWTIVLGNGFGSSFARRYVEQHPAVEKVEVLSGGAYRARFIGNARWYRFHHDLQDPTAAALIWAARALGVAFLIFFVALVRLSFRRPSPD